MTAASPPANALSLKPTHKALTTYYDALARFRNLGVKHETAVRSAFQELLEHCARQFDWKLAPEYAIKRKGKADAKADGALLDSFGLNHGLWEAKDSDDDLDREIKTKFAIGYPKENILFWQPDCAVLYRNAERFYEADLTKAEDLVHVLSLFLEFAPPAIAEWETAVEGSRDKVPEIGASLKGLIEKERQTNKKSIAAFEGFCSLCRSTLNPNISVEAVEEMIIQHILTERIFRKIFAVADFIQRNVIAREIETVITALNSRYFSRGPAMIRDEDGLLTGYVYLDLATKDYGGFVTKADRLWREKLKLPPGYTYKWSGEYEFELRAKSRLKIIVPIVFFVIFLVLYMVFHSATEAAVLIFPTFYAMTEGLILQYWLGYNISVAVWVGHIVLFGIAVETGVVMVVYLHESLDKRLASGIPLKHEDIEAAVIEGAVQRLRPKLMTVTAVLASLMPILWESGIGSDVMKPIAAPIVGGMVTSTIHVLILVPVFFAFMKERALRRGTLDSSSASSKV